MTATFTLSPQDAYGLARALVGMSWDNLQLSPAVGLLLAHLDPNAPPPLLPQRAADLNIVPELPASAKVTDSQIQQASGVGKWLNDYIRWAGSAANETPLTFHLAAIAVGRRLYIHTPGGSRSFLICI